MASEQPATREELIGIFRMHCEKAERLRVLLSASQFHWVNKQIRDELRKEDEAREAAGEALLAHQ